MNGPSLMKQNKGLRNSSAESIVDWAASQGGSPIATTSMGPHSAVLLHLVSLRAPDTPVVWVDTGYNSTETYVVAEQLIALLSLDVRVYTSIITTSRRKALAYQLPGIEDVEERANFTQEVKLEPFERALSELQPSLWLTGIRREETEFRRGLDVLSPGPDGITKVAPLFYWSVDEMEQYIDRHSLPACRSYFDPTKVQENLECGLHRAMGG